MTERLVFGYGTRTSGNAPSLTAPPLSPPPKADPGPPSVGPEKRDWAFIGLLLFTALLYLRPQDTFRVLVPLRLPELAAIFALGALFLGRMQRGLMITRVTPELLGVLALGGVILGTAPLSIWMGGAIDTFFDQYAKVMLIFILMVNTLTSPKRIERLTWLLVVASGVIAARSVFDYVRGVNLVEDGRVLGSVGGMFKNPNDLALNMVAVLPLSFALLLRPLSASKRAVALGCALAMLGAIVASQSRSGTVGLAAMLGVVLWQLLRSRPGIVAAVVLSGVLAAPLLPSSYWQRMASITDSSLDETGSREARSTLMVEAWSAFLADPLTGVGAGQFVNYNPDGREQAWKETHNVVLQVAAELGIFGLAAFGYLLVRGMRAPREARKLVRLAAAPESPARLTREERRLVDVHAVMVLASLVGWFGCAFFASVAYHWTLYYVLGLAVAPREVLKDRLALGNHPQRAGAGVPVVAGARV